VREGKAGCCCGRLSICWSVVCWQAMSPMSCRARRAGISSRRIGVEELMPERTILFMFIIRFKDSSLRSPPLALKCANQAGSWCPVTVP